MNTDLKAIKDTAIAFLNLEPTPIAVGDFGNLFVSHPYLNTSYVFVSNEKQMFNIFEDTNRFKKWKKEYEAQIKAIKNVRTIFL